MQVPDQIRKCVVFLGYRLADGGTKLAGTGFLVARPYQEGLEPSMGSVCPSFTYLLTAKHVLEGIQKQGIDEVLIRFNYRDGKARWVSSKIDDWQYHPTESDTVDVALFNASGFSTGPVSHDHGVFPIAGFVNPTLTQREPIGIGDETFIVGLFASHHGNTKNIPIVRIGNIAAMPEEKVSTSLGGIDAYLIEARSMGGLSGSPVFVNMGRMRTIDGELYLTKGTIYLLGLMHGHFDDKHQSINMGIGIVVPASKILEVINQEAILKIENESREYHHKQDMPVMDSLPDSVDDFTEQDFESDLRKATRRVAPSEPDSKEMNIGCVSKRRL